MRRHTNRKPAGAAGRVRRPALKIETLESRLAMDGAGFVNTDPPEDPDSIVGVAGVAAENDYVSVADGTRALRLSPLDNDTPPENATSLRIKSVSNTRLGATVTISEDGRHLLYTAGEEGLQSRDSFYYIVETEDGQLGKADVQLSVKHRASRGGGGYTSTPNSNDRFTTLEDSGEQRLEVLANDRQLIDPTVVAVSTASLGGGVRIAEDGSAVFYTPAPGQSGTDHFTYTARGADGQEQSYTVRVEIRKPYEIINRRHSVGGSDDARLDFGGGPVVLDPLANDALRGPADLPPRIDGFVAPGYAGTVELADDGRTLLYDPAEGFQGAFRIEYTVRYGGADHQTVSGSFAVSVLPHFLAAPDWFALDPSVDRAAVLDVLGNDPLLNPYASRHVPQAHYLPSVTRSVGLSIVEVSAGSAGGVIAVAEDGQRVSYTAADGFRGDETFVYTVEDSTGQRQTAEVTVHVAEPTGDPLLDGRFATEGELQQFLIDRAVQRYASQFGQYVTRYGESTPGGWVDYRSVHLNTAVATSFSAADANGADHSDTNTQVAGVDEADIVETDGRYLYTFSEGQLAIVDLQDPSNPRLTSISRFSAAYDKMYLQGDRITLLQSGSRSRGGAEVLVLELGDRTEPTVVERTEIDGQIVDSRAIGDRVHLVVHKSFDFPELSGEFIIEPTPPAGVAPEAEEHSGVGSSVLFSVSSLGYAAGDPGVWRNESLNEYVARVRGELLEAGLPTFKTYDASEQLVASGLLTQPTSVHRPILGDDLAVAFVTLDAGDDQAGPAGDATTFIADSRATVYMSTDAAYVFSYDNAADTTTLHKISLNADGGSSLVATGTIRGHLLNQFAADEHNGLLRVATTQQERDNTPGSRWRQTRLFNNLFVLEQRGAELVVVGEIANLAPTETIHAVRYQGDRAFVVTFRVVDPLFAIDLSDPAAPTVEGALKIPGFSNYLHPVGADHLIGIGRDADEITGRAGPLQVTLFNVADLSNPTVADQLTFEGADWVNSEAWIDHHAVSFFAADEAGFAADGAGGGVLTLPINWTEPAEGESWASRTTRRSGLFTIEVSTSGAGSLASTGQIEHDPVPASEPGFYPVLPRASIITTHVWQPPIYQQSTPTIRRAIRVGESLVTVSDKWVEVHALDSPGEQLGRVFLGKPAVDDRFTLEEDSGPQSLDVLANDLPLSNGDPPTLAAVTQPAVGGVVTVAEDGRSLTFTPADDFFGNASFTYTLNDPVWGESETTVSIWVQNTPDAPIAVDDKAAAEVNAAATVLGVLANDIDPDQRASIDFQHYAIGADGHLVDTVYPWTAISIHSPIGSGDIIKAPYSGGLRITEVGAADQGGTVEIDAWGRLAYQPADGFEGIETFTYTIENASGLTDVGTVTVVVGELPTVATTETAPRSIAKSGINSSGLAPLRFVPPAAPPTPATTLREFADTQSTPNPAAFADTPLLLLLQTSAAEIDEAVKGLTTFNSPEPEDAESGLKPEAFALSQEAYEDALTSF